jgi:NADPH2:quinone reductase
MKAIVVHEFGGPEVLKLEEVPDPRPGPGQVVVRVEAAGVNPVETYIRAGKYGPRQFPYTPGSDSGGIVDSVGSGVTSFKAGDRVYTSASISGTYAQLALCTEAQVHPLPANVTTRQGAAVGVPYATAYRAAFIRTTPRGGETVLVHGASGGVGIAAVQLMRAAGLTVIGTAGSEKGLKLVREQGAHHALDHTKPDYLQELPRLTGGKGVDLILEMAARTNLGKDLTVLAKNGRVVVIGSRGPVEINPRDGMTRDAAILPMTLMNATEPELKGIHAALRAGMELGALRPVMGREFPLADAPKAHEAILQPGSYGKIVLIP